MPDHPVEPGPGGTYPPDMEARLRVLEEIAAGTKAVFERIDRRFDALERWVDTLGTELRGDIRDLRADIRYDIRDLRAELYTDLPWTIGLGLAATASILAVMAHGFHWY
jgi:hypothetical protein